MDIEFCVSDADLDALQDLVDIDDDNDGIPDIIETGGVDPTSDADNDGVYLYLDDDDNDPFVLNNKGMVESAYDFDGDNVPNHFDLDSDNDGIADVIEAGGTDANGEVDYPTVGDPGSMIDVDYFILERSDDAFTWTEIAQVDAVGNSTSLSAYNWIDHNPLNGVSYYRLKVVDIDFNIEYSQIEVVNRAQESEILVYPNPANDVVALKADFEVDSQVDIVSMTGAIVHSKRASNASSMTFDISSLATGCYYFNFILSSGERVTHKLIVSSN